MNGKLLVMAIIIIFYLLGIYFGMSIVKPDPEIKRIFFNTIVEEEVIKEVPVPVIEEKYIEVDRKYIFEQMAEQLAEQNYDMFEYNCMNYSNDLVKLLRIYGYSAKVVKGIVDCDSGYFDKTSCEYYEGRHVWVIVEIPIEATTGKVIEPDVYNNYYKKGGW